MPYRLQLDPAQMVQEFAELSGRLVRGGEMLRSVKDHDVADRDDAQDGGVPAGQDDALSLRRRDRIVGQGPGARRLRPGRPLHDGRPAGGPLARAQPARARRGSVRGGLGQPDAHRPLAHDRRLRRRLSRRMRRVHLPRARRGPDQPARHLRGRRVHRLLRGAASGARQEPDPDDHADRLPCRPGRTGAQTTASSTCGRAA